VTGDRMREWLTLGNSAQGDMEFGNGEEDRVLSTIAEYSTEDQPSGEEDSTEEVGEADGD